jgi:hypothetical protein
MERKKNKFYEYLEQNINNKHDIYMTTVANLLDTRKYERGQKFCLYKKLIRK